MNKKILLMFVFLLALPVVNAFCYQESANVSTACVDLIQAYMMILLG